MCSCGRMTMRRGPCGSSTCIGRCCRHAALLTLPCTRRGSDMVVGSAGVRRWPGVIYGAVSSSIVCHTRAKMGVLSLVWHNLCHRMRCKRLESMSWLFRDIVGKWPKPSIVDNRCRNHLCHTRAKIGVFALVWHAIRDLSHGSR